MTRATAGHGATIAMELNPTMSPGVFTIIAELNGDIKWPAVNRKETEVTPHQDTIDSYVLGVLSRDALTFGCNFIFDDPTHDQTTGVYAAIRDNETRGFRLRGPNGTAGQDEWITSGQVQNIQHTDPVRTGVRTLDVTVRLSGPMIVDGVVYGTVVT